VEPGNWPALLDAADMATPDAVIDACDQLSAKLAMALWARAAKACFVSVGAAGGKRLAHRVDVADLAETTHDPLLASLRYRLRREHGAPRESKKIGIACVFSREAVQQADASCLLDGAADAAQDSTLNCHGYGSVVSVTATFGQCAAGWVLDQLASQPG
jgi:tRNA A37 threonylcarbamoyladenosine dehydratase